METIIPRDLDEAVAAAAAHPEATLLAGGTDLMVRVTYGGFSPERVIALRRLPELRERTERWIGSAVTYRTLESSPWPGLAAAARTVGSPQVRSAATIGGNLGTASPAGDGLPFLAAVDATIVLRSADGDREIRWDEFVVGPKRTSRQPGELIVGVRLPERLPARQAFAKVGTRSAMVIAVTSCCLTRDEDGTTRVALGSVGPTPIRARQAEAMISAERNPSAAARAEFVRLVMTEVRPITDHRSTADYRRHASGVIAGRLLDRVLS